MKEKPNLLVLKEFRIRGKAQHVGAVIPKVEFGPVNDAYAKGAWQNLAHMRPPRVEETDEPVRDAPKGAEDVPQGSTDDKKNKAAMPGATRS